jgi:hypothetical protein
MLKYRWITCMCYIENIQGEFWYDEAAQELYVWPNTTSPDGNHAGATGAAAGGPPAVDLVVPVLQTLIRFKGTAKAPVVGVTIQGVNFRDAAYTFMERFGRHGHTQRLTLLMIIVSRSAACYLLRAARCLLLLTPVLTYSNCFLVHWSVVIQ